MTHDGKIVLAVGLVVVAITGVVYWFVTRPTAAQSQGAAELRQRITAATFTQPGFNSGLPSGNTAGDIDSAIAALPGGSAGTAQRVSANATIDAIRSNSSATAPWLIPR